MSLPEREHAEALLAEVLIGERQLDCAEVQAALVRFPELADGLDGLRTLDRRLADLARDARAVATPGRADSPGPSQAELAALVRRHGVRRVWPARALLAAVLLVGVGLAAFWLLRRDSAPVPQLLGPLSPGQLEAVVVGGEVEFGWNFALPEGAEYVLRVYVGVAGTRPILLQNTGRRSSWRMKLADLEARAKGATGPLIWEVRASGPAVGDGLGLGPAQVPR